MKKVIYSLVFLGVLLGVMSGCSKLFPFEFSEGNNVESFVVNNFTTGVVLGKTIINPNAIDEVDGSEYGLITIVVNKGNEYFPLVFNMKSLVLSAGAKVMNWPDELSLAFSTPFDTKWFYVVSAKGNVKKWVINIVDRTLPPIDPNKANTNILGFDFLPSELKNTNGKDVILASDVNITSDSIYLTYYTDGTTPLQFPIGFKPVFKLPAGAYFGTPPIIPPGVNYNPGDTMYMTFNSLTEIKMITIMGADSFHSKNWYVQLDRVVIPPPPPGSNYSEEADITDFKVAAVAPSASLSMGAPIIDKNNKIIYIPEYNSYSFSKPIQMIVGTLTVSDKAQLPADYTGNFQFASFTDTKSISITAESGKKKTWTIQLLYSPQIPNSGFETWGTSQGFPILGGGQWSCNNFLPNSMVSNVVIVSSNSDAFEGSKCAEITTQYIIRGAAGVNSTTPVSGGMVFLGAFNFSASEAAIRNPLSTYSFGVPFGFAPTYMHVAFKYAPYTPMIQATINSFSTVFGNAVPSFGITNTGETDYCDIWIRVLDVNNKVIGEGRLSTNKAFPKWTEVYIPITYTATATPATLDIRCSSSKDGLSYKGGSGATGGGSNATGSKLSIDDIKLIYVPGIPYSPTPQDLGL